MLRELVLSDRVRLFTLGGDELATSYGANCVAVRGERGTLLVDPLVAPAHARQVEEALGRTGFPPVEEVVLTHHHTDHALGAGLFGRRGTRVAAHRLCALSMAAEHPALVAARRSDPRLSDLFSDAWPHRPGVLFEARHRLDLGGLPVEVRHLGHGHTPGDAVVVVPAEGLAVCGDLVLRGYHANYEDADRRGAREALRDLALAAERFVPGHGEPGGPELLAAQAAYHEEVERLSRAARTPAEAEEALRERFPGHLLEAALPVAVRFFRGPAP